MEGTDLSSVRNSDVDGDLDVNTEKQWAPENRLLLEKTHTDVTREDRFSLYKESTALCSKLPRPGSFSGEKPRPRTLSDIDFTKDVITLGERINNVNLCMEWIREELVAMRALDWSLKKQFHELNRQIQEIKVAVDQEEAFHGREFEEEGEDKTREANPKKSADSGYNSEDNLSPLSSPRYFFEMTI